VTIAAGAVHGEKAPNYVGHGYSFGTLFLGHEGHTVARIRPRFMAPNTEFRPHVAVLPDGQLHADHTLPFVARLLADPTAAPGPSDANDRDSEQMTVTVSATIIITPSGTQYWRFLPGSQHPASR
jgi:hypothetical protein